MCKLLRRYIILKFLLQKLESDITLTWKIYILMYCKVNKLVVCGTFTLNSRRDDNPDFFS